MSTASYGSEPKRTILTETMKITASNSSPSPRSNSKAICVQRVGGKELTLIRRHLDSSSSSSGSDSDVSDSESVTSYHGSDNGDEKPNNRDDVIDAPDVDVNATGERSVNYVSDETVNVQSRADPEGCVVKQRNVPHKLNDSILKELEDVKKDNEKMKAELFKLKGNKDGIKIKDVIGKKNTIGGIRAILRETQSRPVSSHIPKLQLINTEPQPNVERVTPGKQGTSISKARKRLVAAPVSKPTQVCSQATSTKPYSAQLVTQSVHSATETVAMPTKKRAKFADHVMQSPTIAHVQKSTSESTETRAHQSPQLVPSQLLDLSQRMQNPAHQPARCDTETHIIKTPTSLDMRLMQPVPSRETLTFLQDLCSYFTELLKQPNPYAATVSMTPYCHCHPGQPSQPWMDLTSSVHSDQVVSSLPSQLVNSAHFLGTLREDLERGHPSLNSLSHLERSQPRLTYLDQHYLERGRPSLNSLDQLEPGQQSLNPLDHCRPILNSQDGDHPIIDSLDHLEHGQQSTNSMGNLECGQQSLNAMDLIQRDQQYLNSMDNPENGHQSLNSLNNLDVALSSVNSPNILSIGRDQPQGQQASPVSVLKPRKRRRSGKDLSDPSLFCCPCHPRSSGTCIRCHGPNGACSNCRNSNCRFRLNAKSRKSKPDSSHSDVRKKDVIPNRERFIVGESKSAQGKGDGLIISSGGDQESRMVDGRQFIFI